MVPALLKKNWPGCEALPVLIAVTTLCPPPDGVPLPTLYTPTSVGVPEVTWDEIYSWLLKTAVALKLLLLFCTVVGVPAVP